MPSIRGKLLATSSLAAILVAGRTEAAPTGDEIATRCVNDAANAQRARDAGHLVEGRAAFVRCSAEECPTMVRRDCAQWLVEVDERLPTIVLSTRGEDGKDLVGTQVTLDGTALPVGALGRSMPLDPGPHRLIATHAGYRDRTESIVVKEREKGRAVPLVLEPLVTATVPGKRHVPVLSWILGGVAVLGGAGFGVFWWKGMDEVSSLRGSCAPYCTDADVSGAETPLNVARVSLGVGIAALAGAVAVYALSSPERVPASKSAAR